MACRMHEDDGRSPPPVRRKGASEVVKTATRRSARDSPSPSSSPPLSSLPLLSLTPGLDCSRGGREKKNLPRAGRSPVSPAFSDHPHCPCPPSYKYSPDKATTHPIPISSISEQRQSNEKALLSPVETELQEKESLRGASCSFPGKDKIRPDSSRSSSGNAFLGSLARGILLGSGDCAFAARLGEW
jgi:hypothetical protein